jgi:pimeloyl-ACP methyl ester carboxylesterase
MRKAPRSGAFSIYPAAKLSRRSFHIPTRIILKFFPAFFRAEEIFPTRKLRLKLRSLLVQFHSTNRISRHNYSSHRICSSYPPPHSKVLSVLGPAQVTDPVHFPSQKILVYTKPPKKILLPPCTLYPPSPGTTTLILPYHTPRPMRLSRRSRRLLLFLALYLAFCLAAGIFVADGTLHPARRPLTPEEETTMREIANHLDSDLEEVSITTPDAITLRAWVIHASTIHPHRNNGDAVILLHGLGDNRIGMTGYAQLLLTHGFTVLLPDARAHGQSGGQLATYGLLERNDIHQWFDFLLAQAHPHCIYGLGESMGAAELLESLEVEPRFCAVAAESSFSSFREIAYDRMGQPFHLGPWFGRTLLRPVVEFAFLYARWKYHLDLQQVSPENSVATTKVPVLLIHGQIDSNIPPSHAYQIQARNPKAILWEVPNADHCGAISTAPEEFDQRLQAWFSRTHVETAASAVEARRENWQLAAGNWRLPFCISCASPVHNQPTRSSRFLRSRNPANRTPALQAAYSHISAKVLDPCQSVKIRGKHFPQLHQKY